MIGGKTLEALDVKFIDPPTVKSEDREELVPQKIVDYNI